MTATPSFGWLQWLRPSRIGPRLLAFHLLLVFLPVAGILYLEVYENQLLEAQERSMVQQGRLIAAALGGAESLDAADANALLQRLERRGDARIRIYDPAAVLLADSARVPDPSAAGRAEGASDYETVKGVRQRLLYRVGAWIAGVRRVIRAVLVRSQMSRSAATTTNTGPGPELKAALEGRYGAETRGTPGQRSLTL